MKSRVLAVIAIPFFLTCLLSAQTCSNTVKTGSLICTVPQLFGPGGLTLPNERHSAHFNSASLDTFKPLNTAIGEELSTLPLGSAGSGISFSFDKEHNPLYSEDSLGPILTERAGVIGRKKIDLGVAYQYYNFGKIDGLNLSRLPAVLGHVQFDINGVKPSFENDYITTLNNVHVDLNQTVAYAVFGVTSRLDVSAEIPIEQVHTSVSSNATIVRTVACEMNGTCNDASSKCGEYHYFVEGVNCADALSSVNKTFTNGGDASGLGDVILRGKFQAIRGEKLGASVGIAFRLPTGDEKNFLGSGTLGVAPFGALTYRARLSPHVRVGYQWNGNSVLAGDPTSTIGSKASLPPEVLYSAGVDYKVTRRFTLAADLIGARVLGASRLSLSTVNEVTGNGIPDIVPLIGDYSSDAIGVGAKIRLKGRLVVIGNVTSRIDDGGLHAAVVPLVGVSYSF